MLSAKAAAAAEATRVRATSSSAPSSASAAGRTGPTVDVGRSISATAVGHVGAARDTIHGVPLPKKLKLPPFARSRAVQLLQSPEKLRAVLEDAWVKMTTVEGTRSLERVIDDLRTMLRLVRASVNGTYTEVSKANLAYIVGAVVYFLVPLDSIPDILGPFGYLDDAAVILWVIGLVEEELERFKDWERRHGAQALAAVESDARVAGVAKAKQTSAVRMDGLRVHNSRSGGVGRAPAEPEGSRRGRDVSQRRSFGHTSL